MFINHDRLKEHYLASGFDFGRAVHYSVKHLSEMIDTWLDKNSGNAGRIVVVYGAPGVGKSYMIEHVCGASLIVAELFIIETSGLNTELNKKLLAIPRERVIFTRVSSNKARCIRNVQERDCIYPNLEKINGAANLVNTIERWFNQYSGLNQPLPVDSLWRIDGNKLWKVPI